MPEGLFLDEARIDLRWKKTRQKWISEPICGLFTYNYTSYPIPPIEEEFKITW